MPESEDSYRAAIARALERLQAEAEPLLPAADAERLARKVDEKPRAGQIMLARSRGAFGRIEVARALLQFAYAERHRGPEEMFRWLAVALRFIRHLDVPARLASLKFDLQGELWTHLGNAWRISGRLASAKRAFSRATAAFLGGTGDPLLHAQLLAFRGSNERDLHNFPASAWGYREAALLYRSAGEEHLAAEAVVALATLRIRQGKPRAAVPLLLEAEPGIDTTRDPVLYLGFYVNLITALLEAGDLDRAQASLSKTRYLHARFKGHLGLTRLRWIEARLLAKRQQYRRCFVHFDAVRRVFVEREKPYEAALCALDLAEIYARLGFSFELRELAEEMQPVLASKGLTAEARKALEQWAETARQGRMSEQLIAPLRADLERWQATPVLIPRKRAPRR